MEKETFQIYEWIIENFSFWNSYVHGDSIKSPNFVEHGCIQRMELLKRNFPCKYIQISFSVAKSEPSGGNLSIIGADGKLIYSGRVSEIIQGNNYFVPRISFEALAALIRKNKAQYEDRLTFRLCFLSNEGLVDRVSTTLDVLNKSLQIDTKSIASISLNDYKDISIIHYNKNNDSDQLLLRAYRRHQTTEFILHLLTKSAASVFVKCQWRLHGSDNTLLTYKEIVHLYKIGGPWSFSNSLAMSDLVDHGISMHVSLEIVNGNFTEKNLKSSQDMSVTKKTICFDEKSAETIASSTSNKTGDSVSALAKDFMSLHPSDEHLELKCGNISFPVHKDILAARSPVFKHLLSMETVITTVDITNLDAATLSQFITFLYSRTLEGLNVEIAMKLCDAADNYQVSSLKTVCSAFLCDNVTRSNVCEIISHANKHQNVELILLATKKILQNYNEVIGSEKWKSFVRIEPLLAAEVLTNFAAKFCVGHGRKIR